MTDISITPWGLVAIFVLGLYLGAKLVRLLDWRAAGKAKLHRNAP